MRQSNKKATIYLKEVDDVIDFFYQNDYEQLNDSEVMVDGVRLLRCYFTIAKIEKNNKIIYFPRAKF